MRAVGLDEPLFVRRGEGAYIEDVDGNRYVDWVMSWGPLIFGHADPETVDGGRSRRPRTGRRFGAPTEREVELAAEIADAVPSIEKVRLVSSGTEAAMSAVRLARGLTAPRPDPEVRRLLPRPRRRAARERRLRASRRSASPPSPGVPRGAAADTIVCPYNDVDAAAAARSRAYGEGLACVHRRAGRREHGRRPARAGLPRGAALALRRLRRAARLRRGDHGLPRRPRRRAGALRRRRPT